MKKTSSMALSELEYKAIQTGGKIQFDTQMDAAGVASYIFSSYMGRHDLATAVLALPSQDFISKIEKIRNALFFNELELAEKLLAEVTPQSPEEVSELLLERCRLELFKGNFETMFNMSEQLLRNPALTPWSRVTVHELRGQSLINLERVLEAIHELRYAVSIDKLYQTTDSGFTAQATLAVCYSKLNKMTNAERELEATKALLRALPHDGVYVERLAKTLRAEKFYFEAKEDFTSAIENLREAKSIYEWMNDSEMRDRCIADLERLKNAVAPERKTFDFPTWKYLSRHALILVMTPKSIIDLSNSELNQKILNIVCSKPIEISELFLKVWDLNYVKHRHETHLRAALSKLRKVCPADAIQVVQGVVSAK